MFFDKCEICKWRNIVKVGEKKFFARFPLDIQRCKKWVQAVGEPQLARLSITQLHYSHYLCGKHFTNDAFEPNKLRLRSNAVPTLHLFRSPLSDEFLKDFPKKKLIIPESALIVRKTITLHANGTLSTNVQPVSVMSEHNYCQKTTNANGTLTTNVNKSVRVISEHNYSQKTTNGDAITNTNTDIDDAEDNSACSSVNDNSKEANQNKMEIGNTPVASITQTHRDIADKGDYSTPVCSSVVDTVSEDTKKIEINNVVLTWSSPNSNPSASSIQSNVSYYNSLKTIKMGPVMRADENQGGAPTKKPKTFSEINRALQRTKRQLNEIRKKYKVAQRRLTAIDSIKSPLLKSLIDTEISNSKKKAHGKRWSTFVKCAALAVYKKAPGAYTYLEKMLPLPNRKTLKKLLQEIHAMPGIDENLLAHLGTPLSNNSVHNDKVTNEVYEGLQETNGIDR